MILPYKQLAIVLGLLVPCLASGQADEPKTARDYHERGCVHEGNKQDAEALADYSKAVELDPRFIDAWSARSSLHADRKEYSKSIADLTKVIEIKPGDYPALFNRAGYHESVRDYDKAIADYSEVLDGDADFSRSGSRKEEDLALTYHYRGRAYHWYRRDYVNAIADYTRALQLDPNIQMVHYRRGTAYHALREYAKAEEDYAAALKCDPNYPNLLDSWARQLATCPDPKFRDGKRAVEMATKANEKFGRTIARHVDTLAAAYAEIGQFDEAVKWQKKALELLDTKNTARRKAMQERIELFQAGRPFHDKANMP
jgi:tetratricopeptide (TPR) repeat protein